jgi:hypothetical protein
MSGNKTTCQKLTYLNNGELLLINTAIEEGIRQYIKTRKEKVPEFVSNYFSFKGALRLNKRAFGGDLYKVPANILWMPPYLLGRLASKLTSRIGMNSISEKINRLPKGFETDVEREINWLIYSELLEIPYQQGDRESKKDAILEACLEQPEVKILLNQYLSRISEKSKHPGFRVSLEKNIEELTNCRTAASDMAGCIVSMASGAALGNQFTPGAYTSGTLLANVLAQQIAISNCVFGSGIGSMWYGVFPAQASLGLLTATVGSFMIGLGLLSAFSGVITDPIQAKLGIHQKRLIKLIEKIEAELLAKDNTQLHFKGTYAKYIFDIADIFRTLALRV